MKRLIIIALVVVVVAGAVIIGWWGFSLNDISIVNENSIDQTAYEALQTCSQKSRGKSYIFMSQRDFQKELINCDAFIDQVSLEFDFPRTLKVHATYFVPLTKMIAGEHCLVLGRNRHTIIPVDRCLEIMTPIITGITSLSNEPLNQYISSLAAELKDGVIAYNSMNYITEGGSSWFSIDLDGSHKVLVGINAPVEEKIATLKAALKGLSEAKEKYSIIDLRFDRVVYK